MISRPRHCRTVLRLRSEFPVVKVVGARQTDKITLAWDMAAMLALEGMIKQVAGHA